MTVHTHTHGEVRAAPSQLRTRCAEWTSIRARRSTGRFTTTEIFTFARPAAKGSSRPIPLAMLPTRASRPWPRGRGDDLHLPDASSDTPDRAGQLSHLRHDA